MRVCVYGLYHLGCVTAACLADAGFHVIGIDDHEPRVRDLQSAKPPLFEPNLAELIGQGIQKRNLSFTNDLKIATDADVVWVTYDTPVDEDDHADVDFVTSRIVKLFPYLKENAVLLVSSQLPVGTMAKLETSFRAAQPGKAVHFACSPENLRLGTAIDAFKTQARVAVGCLPSAQPILERLISPFCRNILWMSLPSAEMTKHGVNSYLAMCIAWTNELAVLCEQTGADAAEVEKALRAEPRIGAKAYVRAGAPFGGGTLARDVRFLQQLSSDLPLLASIIPSNTRHADWPLHVLNHRMKSLKDQRIAVLGLAYKPDTSSLRRSMALRWCEKLLQRGATVQAYDPQVTSWPEAPAGFSILPTIKQALDGADALIIATEWSVFKQLTASSVLQYMRRPLVLDQGRFLAQTLASDDAIDYVSVGRSA